MALGFRNSNLFLVCSAVVSLKLFWYYEINQEQPSSMHDSDSVPKIVILMWTKYYGVTGNLLMKAILSGRKWDKECCHKNKVLLTFNRNMLNKATVVVFFNHRMNLNK